MAKAGVNQLPKKNKDAHIIVLTRLLRAIHALEYLDKNSLHQTTKKTKRAHGKTISDNFESDNVHTRAYAKGGKIGDKCVRYHVPAPMSVIRFVCSRRALALL